MKGPTKVKPSAKRAASPAPVEAMTLVFADAGAWAAWLATNHASSRGLWLQIAKTTKGANVSSVTYAEAVEVALAWGWIDGQKGKLDDAWWLQKFAPRRPKSIWSKINCRKVEALALAGKMMPAGLAAVASAKADGRWDAAYESQSRMTVPPDFAEALAKSKRAARFFETLDSANRYAVLFRVHTAKKPETRAARVAALVAMLDRQEKLHP